MKPLFSRNRQFVLYCLIGASGVTLDFLTYSALIKAGWVGYQVANGIGYASGTLLSFFLNAYFNFRTRDWLAFRLVLFFLVALIGWAASAGTLYVLVGRLEFDKYLSKLLTLLVVLALQYNLNRVVSFRKSF